jgi:ferritin-like metal-binding protein YciE
MTSNTLEEQLIKYLTDAHSIERQALVQMERAPKIAGDPEIANQFEQHLRETQRHEELVRERLEAHGNKPSTLKDIAGTATGIGFALFAKFNPDTPGKLVAHGYSYEHMEVAAYEMLTRVAELAADEETARVTESICQQERAMAERLGNDFDRAVEASLREKDSGDFEKELVRYLTDAHAIEAQAIQLLDKGQKIANFGALATAFEEHLEETRGHQRLIDGRLEARGESSSKLKDAALSLGALNWGGFFGAQPDTPAKLTAFAYAFEHLEIASYELLLRMARRAVDLDTESVAQQILGQERAAAQRIHSLFGEALDAALHAQGLGVRG